jgi:hypothetical protein
VSACALGRSATEPTATNAITDSAGARAQRPLRRFAIGPGGTARGSHTTRPWQSESNPIESQNGIT